MLQLKDKKLSIVATDLDIIFYDEIKDVQIIDEGSTTTSAAILYDILRKIPSNAELRFDLKSENKLSLKSERADFNLLACCGVNKILDLTFALGIPGMIWIKSNTNSELEWFITAKLL